MTAWIRAAAIVLACAAAAYPIAAVESPPFPSWVSAAGAVLAIAGVLARRGGAVWGGVTLLGTGYVAALTLRGGDVDPVAPAVAVALFLVVEAADVAASDGARAVRLWHSLSVSFVAALVSAALLIAGTAFRTAGPVAVAATAVCGALLLSGLAAFAGHSSRDDA